MTARVFFLNTLRPDASREEYERWVREVDYPFARSLPAIERYEVTRVEGLLAGEGEPPCHYLEVVEVSDLDEYRSSLSGSPEVEELLRQWSSFVAQSVAVYGQVIE